ADDVVSSWKPLLDGPGAVVVEALGADLAKRVVDTELARDGLTTVERASRAGGQIERGPVAFVRAAIAAKRAPLGLFVLEGTLSFLKTPRTSSPDEITPLQRATRHLSLTERQR